MPLITALGRQRQGDLSEFEASLVYKESSETVRDVIQKSPVSKNPKRNEKDASKRTNSIQRNLSQPLAHQKTDNNIILTVLHHYGSRCI